MHIKVQQIFERLKVVYKNLVEVDAQQARIMNLYRIRVLWTLHNFSRSC